MFHIGQKVVCIKPGGVWDKIEKVELDAGVRGPGEGEILTIRDISEGWGGVYFRFFELKNPRLKYQNLGGGFGEAKFSALHFRPLIEKRPTYQR